MFDARQVVLRSLRYHSPTDEIRESFTIQGNDVICTRPHLLDTYRNTSPSQNSTTHIDSYIRKSASGTGRQRVKGHKRVPKQLSLEEQLLAVDPPENFMTKAMRGVGRYLR